MLLFKMAFSDYRRKSKEFMHRIKKSLSNRHGSVDHHLIDFIESAESFTFINSNSDIMDEVFVSSSSTKPNKISLTRRFFSLPKLKSHLFESSFLQRPSRSYKFNSLTSLSVESSSLHLRFVKL